MKYNVKMRAEKDGRHISGAERIVGENEIESALHDLVKRAKEHPNGEAENITVKIYKIKREIITIPPLNITESQIRSPEEARALLSKELENLGLSSKEILNLFYSLKSMRGAVLLDTKTLKRLEPKQERGIRATCMDYEGNAGSAKNHFKEALCLASKVASCPYIIGELCASDDAEYTTGYFASSKRGYIRIPNIKQKGDVRGGRIFLFSGEQENVKECIDYIENHPVFVK